MAEVYYLSVSLIDQAEGVLHADDLRLDDGLLDLNPGRGGDADAGDLARHVA